MRRKAALIALLPLTLIAAGDGTVGPARYDAEGRMQFPADYRHWVYLSSGYGMTYGPLAPGMGPPAFDTVFVDRASHDAFQQSGRWPDGAMFVLEVRGSKTEGSINKNGAFQSGAPLGVEVHVKDSKRFAATGGWAFFGFEGAKPARMLPASASCYACHQKSGAVDTTFTQFYPTMLPIAQKMGTLSPAYVAEEAALEAAHKGK